MVKKLYASEDPIRIGVSSCLLGEQVRFDGGHKRSDFPSSLAPRSGFEFSLQPLGDEHLQQ